MSSDLSVNQSNMGEPGWEFTVFAEELSRGLASLRADYRDFLDERLESGGDAVGDPVNDLVQRMAVSRAIIGRVDRILAPSAIAKAFGAPGQPGNDEEARRLARSIVTVFSTMLQWGREARRAIVDSQWRTIYSALANFARQPLQQMVDFADDIAAKAAAVKHDLESGRTPSTRVFITLELEVGAGDLAALSNEIAAADVLPKSQATKRRVFRR